MLAPDNPQAMAEHAAVWPLKRMPVIVDGPRTVIEASIIVEYLDLYHPGRVRFVPSDARAALEVRTMDRFFDNYVMTPMQRIVFDVIRSPDARHPPTVQESHELLDTSYRWLNDTLKGREWASGGAFGLADCAAAPALFYSDWVHPIDPLCRSCAHTGSVCLRDRRLRAPWMKRGHTVLTFRRVHRTVTEA